MITGNRIAKVSILTRIRRIGSTSFTLYNDYRSKGLLYRSFEIAKSTFFTLCNEYRSERLRNAPFLVLRPLNDRWNLAAANDSLDDVSVVWVVFRRLCCVCRDTRLLIIIEGHSLSDR